MPWPTLLALGLSGAAFALALALLLRGALYRPARPLNLVVSRRSDPAQDLFCLTLRRPLWLRWLPLPPFAAGQSVALALPHGGARRRYSIARWRALPFAYELGIRREGQGRLSPHLAEHAQRGARLAVSRPGGSFMLARQAPGRRAVLIAGGIGVTPLLAMLDQWAARRGPYERADLYWQVRHAEEAIYREALASLARQRAELRVRILVSRPAQGPAERISAALLRAELGPLADADFYLCAGSALLDSLLGELAAMDLPAEALHYERFNLGAAETAENWTIAYQDLRFSCAGHASLLDAIEAQGIAIDSDCRTGSCGRCLVAVLSGEAQHRVHPEYPVPPGQLLTCCAVAKSDMRLQPVAPETKPATG